MEIKIENQFCVKRFKPGHSRVARCHKPISILCQERFKPGHSRVARCHKSIFILCQARFKPGHSRVARCHKPIFILCQARFKPGHSRVARCHKPISILCQDFQSKFLNKIIQGSLEMFFFWNQLLLCSPSYSLIKLRQIAS